MDTDGHTPFPPLSDLADEERVVRARAAYERLKTRHSCRDFTDTPVPRAVIEQAIHSNDNGAGSNAEQAVDSRVESSDPSSPQGDAVAREPRP